jgi:hypothetical protein
MLGYCGVMRRRKSRYIMISVRLQSAYYFAHFLIILPIVAAYREAACRCPVLLPKQSPAKHGEAAE